MQAASDSKVLAWAAEVDRILGLLVLAVLAAASRDPRLRHVEAELPGAH